MRRLAWGIILLMFIGGSLFAAACGGGGGEDKGSAFPAASEAEESEG
jgi:hypothetical protein